MSREGWTLRANDLAVLSPYRLANLLRFGDYTTDQSHIPPPGYNPALRTTEEEGAGAQTTDHGGRNATTAATDQST